MKLSFIALGRHLAEVSVVFEGNTERAIKKDNPEKLTT